MQKVKEMQGENGKQKKGPPAALLEKEVFHAPAVTCRAQAASNIQHTPIVHLSVFLAPN